MFLPLNREGGYVWKERKRERERERKTPLSVRPLWHARNTQEGKIVDGIIPFQYSPDLLGGKGTSHVG